MRQSVEANDPQAADEVRWVMAATLPLLSRWLRFEYQLSITQQEIRWGWAHRPRSVHRIHLARLTRVRLASAIDGGRVFEFHSGPLLERETYFATDQAREGILKTLQERLPGLVISEEESVGFPSQPVEKNWAPRSTTGARPPLLPARISLRSIGIFTLGLLCLFASLSVVSLLPAFAVFWWGRRVAHSVQGEPINERLASAGSTLALVSIGLTLLFIFALVLSPLTPLPE